jgi:hypothetical protein
MELAASQKLQARLYTDSRLRKRFFADPVTVGAGFGLSSDAAHELAQLSQESVREFTRVIRRKRLDQVSRLFPLSTELLGREYGDAFKEYLLKEPPPSDQLAWKDALRFAAFFQIYIVKHPLAVSWGRELLRYEAAKVRAIWEEAPLQVLFVRCRLMKLIRLLGEGQAPQKASAMPSLVFVLRSSRPDGVRVFSL